jgi:hypothetical protein
MTTYYWVGGSGTWDNANTINWSTSSGGAGSAGIPTGSDDVFFDANSNSSSYIITLASSTLTAGNCRNLTISGPSSGNVSFGTSAFGYLNLTGSMYMSSSGILVGSGYKQITHSPYANSTIAVSLPYNTLYINYILNPNQYEITLASAFMAGGSWTINSSLNTAGYAISTLGFTNTGTATRSLKLGSSIIYMNGNAFALNGTGLILDAGTSTIIQTSTTGYPITLTGTSVNLYNLVYIANATNYNITTVNPATFNTISLGRSDNSTVSTKWAGRINANTLDLGSPLNPSSRIFFEGLYGTPATINANVVNNFSYLDFFNINGSGGLSSTANSIGDWGGNSGITFDPPMTLYWAGPINGGTLQDSNVWASFDGGSANSALYPLAQHTINVTDTILSNTANLYLGKIGTVVPTYKNTIGSINTLSRSLPLTIGTGVSTYTTIWCSGDMIFGPSISYKSIVGSSSIVFYGNNNQFYYYSNTSGPNVSFINVDKYSGKLTLGSNLNSTASISFSSGIIDLNAKSLTTSSFSGYDSANTSKPVTIISNGANITVTGAGTTISSPFDLSYTTPSNFNLNGLLNVSVVNPTSTPTGVYTGSAQSVSTNVNIRFVSGSYPLTFTTSANNVTFSGFSGSLVAGTRTIYGSLTLSPNMTVAPTTLVTTFSTGSNTFIKTSNVAMPIPITIFTQGSGSFTALDNLNMGTSAFTISPYGTFNANNNNIICGSVNVPAACAAPKIITMGNGTWNITGNAWNMLGSNITIYPNNSTIILSNNTISKTFVGGSSQTYYNLVIGGIGNTTISGNNTFNNITNTIAPANVIFTSNTIQTVSNFGLSGNSGNLISIYSTSPNYKSTLVKSGAGTITVNYLNISSSNAYPTLTWYANNSSNVSNVIGWIFNANPITMVTTGNFFAFF